MTEQIGGSFEYDSTTGEIKGELTLLGELQGYNPDGSGNYVELNLSYLGTATTVKAPDAPSLAATMPSRTSSTLIWTAAPVDPNPTQVPPITSWEVERRTSTDGGSTFSAWSPIGGSPFPAATLTAGETGLATGTPERVFGYRVRGLNAVGPGAWSNEARVVWQTVAPTQPTAPTGLTRGVLTNVAVGLAWQETPDPTVTKHGIFVGSTLTVDNIGATLTAYTWSGLTANTSYSNVNVRRWNGQWSPASNNLAFTTMLAEPVPFTMLMGCSASENAHGGTEEWDGWRAYNESKLYTLCNRTGATRPLYVLYSEDGANLGGSNPDYTTIYNHVRSVLDTFYYGGAGSTHSARWGIELVWSNGNENSDKGCLSPKPATGAQHTSTQVGRYLVSQQALYDAIHYAPGGVRRYPDARAASNPTQEQERLGIVQAWLHPSARYHDETFWSFYPPGRGRGDPVLHIDPRLDWPSFSEANRMDRRLGYLLRPFYRTFHAQRQARIDLGQNPDSGAFRLAIGCGETGQAANPGDRSERPYFAVHGLAGGMWLLANQYGLAMPHACWWDQTDSEANSPHNQLSDEAPNGDHNASAPVAGNNSQATNPSTRVAWQNWMQYDKRQPGSSQPAQWAGNPKSSWSFNGTQV